MQRIDRRHFLGCGAAILCAGLAGSPAYALMGRRGGAGEDIMDGGAGNDAMEGGLHDDIMDGGLGADIVCGGAGADDLDDGDSASVPTFDQLWDSSSSDNVTCGHSSTEWGVEGVNELGSCAAGKVITTAPACP